MTITRGPGALVELERNVGRNITIREMGRHVLAGILRGQWIDNEGVHVSVQTEDGLRDLPFNIDSTRVVVH